ncbi:DNA mismatch repair endonuclease MutL [Shewanella gelidii]|uniref:DNA mismatch repair protein MutL n=1 Tax=Shewanella gelidii TaxID=1642821 RepID=A0A917N8X3_9GAMM|nr:DNA mismatch repair endonuclease MutL [Shewanella gelidii]MCL1097743.1 DNA mismatch repair endonuclease MutL [Shewanella gelidii]GGI79149.1 DNA mismatch repair protein MutL [Shewanella gelidii]
MAIEVLPPQLANQIAAGEVVERPASVIKELVENSIDAGATRIDIDIEKGGSKLIRIRDNGCGIEKDQLALALSRHATSKLHSLDDLDAILSFGFRGEALASISSVSRLTLTSRTKEQTEAWQAYAEGSQMAVKVTPAAHPEGTTIEAVALFFNTPARRRFLKSDKTEFTHIDEWLKRIAMAQPKVHFTLQHNGKSVRNYRAANTQLQFIQRLGQISSRSFAEHALHVDCQHNDLRLSGYLQAPSHFDVNATQLDVHYFYVNGRLVRDRLINHAVRQAFSFAESRGDAKLPCYVMMLDLDPHQVDVNVHPAKHEVRFHQARYIHDFILQALQSAIAEAHSLAFDGGNEQPIEKDIGSRTGQGQTTQTSNHAQAMENSQASADSLPGPAKSFSAIPQSTCVQEPPRRLYEAKDSDSQSDENARKLSRQHQMSSFPAAQKGREQHADLPSQAAIDSYCQLIRPLQPRNHDAASTQRNEQANPPAESFMLMPPLLDGQWWVMVEGGRLNLLPLSRVAFKVVERDIRNKWQNGLVAQPLLMPTSVPLDKDWVETLTQQESLLRQMGVELSIRHQQLIIKKVPSYLRNAKLATVVPELLQWLRYELPAEEAVIAWLAKFGSQDFQQAQILWQGFQSLPAPTQQALKDEAIELPWEQWIKEQLSDTK